MTASPAFERVGRKVRLGEEPSLVDEYAHLSIDERIALGIGLRARTIRERYGCDPGFEKVGSRERLVRY